MSRNLYGIIYYHISWHIKAKDEISKRDEIRWASDKIEKVQEWEKRTSLTLSFCAHRAVYRTELWYPCRSKWHRVKYRKGDLCTQQIPHTLLTSQWMSSVVLLHWTSISDKCIQVMNPKIWTWSDLECPLNDLELRGETRLPICMKESYFTVCLLWLWS